MYIYTWVCPLPQGTLQCKCSFRGGKTEGRQPEPLLEWLVSPPRGLSGKQRRPRKDQQSTTGSQEEVREAGWESRGMGPALI